MSNFNLRLCCLELIGQPPTQATRHEVAHYAMNHSDARRYDDAD